jgi:hypothetical protein
MHASSRRPGPSPWPGRPAGFNNAVELQLLQEEEGGACPLRLVACNCNGAVNGSHHGFVTVCMHACMHAFAHRPAGRDQPRVSCSCTPRCRVLCCAWRSGRVACCSVRACVPAYILRTNRVHTSHAPVICAYEYKCTHACMHACMYIMHIYIYICTCVCTRVHIYQNSSYICYMLVLHHYVTGKYVRTNHLALFRAPSS